VEEVELDEVADDKVFEVEAAEPGVVVVAVPAGLG